MLVISAACALGACAAGSQRVTPATGAGLKPASLSEQSTASARQSLEVDRSDGDSNGTIVYNSVPKPVSSFIASLGFECCQVKEFGDGLNLTHTGKLRTVGIVMRSYACQSGRWNTNDCSTAPNATFAQPITMNVYAVTNTGTHVGALLATRTQTFQIPYRPSKNVARCTGADAGKFYSAVDHVCVNGLGHLITFTFANGPHVPSPAIFSVAYNTSTSGYTPIGAATPCFASSGGCPYDSLNVSADGNGGPVGSVLDPNGAFVNFSLVSNYCDPSKGTGFRLDTGPACWTGLHPQIKVTVGNGNGEHDGDGGGDHNGDGGDEHRGAD